MRLVGVCAIAVLGGCSMMLSLDDTYPASEDADHDGVPDSVDNCKGTPNPDQADSDGDGIGDACDLLSCPLGSEQTNRDIDHDGIDDGCDSCLRGPPDDEDGDGVDDACDDCPGTPDPAQIDTDHDEIGDACDLTSLTKQRRKFFDGFTSGDQSWIEPGWVIADGKLTNPTSDQDTDLDNNVVGGSAWYVAIGLDLPASPTEPDVITIRLVSIKGAAYDCSLEWVAADQQFEISMDTELSPGFTSGSAVDGIPAGSHVTLRARPTADGTGLSCDVPGVVTAAQTPTNPGFVRTGLRIESHDAAITYVDVVQ